MKWAIKHPFRPYLPITLEPYICHMYMKLPFLITFSLLLSGASFAQKVLRDNVVEISGIVMSNDSMQQLLPNAYIINKKRGQISTTNTEGFFSFVAVPGDTIVFTHIGFIPEKLWIPDTLKDNVYLTLVILNWDRTILDPVIVYPWPRPENFKREFLAMQVYTTEYDIAQRNLAIQELKDRAMAMGYDASEMQRHMINLQNQQMYNQGRYYGATPGAAILGALSNPFAWAQFFDALKRGDFKSK